MGRGEGGKTKELCLATLVSFQWSLSFLSREIWSLIIELELRRYCAVILICAVHFLSSRLPHADGMFGRHDSQVWDLGHCGAGAVSQPCTHVLQGSPGCHRGVWHHQHSEWRVDSNEAEITVCRQLKLMIPYLWHGDRTWLSNLSQSYATCKWLYTFFFSFKDTFTRAKNWVKELQRQASPNIVIALAGNKADLANKRAVDLQVITNNGSL